MWSISVEQQFYILIPVIAALGGRIALKATGKHVYCEWPLGRDVQEAEELRDAATSAGVHVAIGLQTRMNPALRKAQKLIESGALGRILSARMYSGTVAFGPTEREFDRISRIPANGATHLTIHGGHAMDAVVALSGKLDAPRATGVYSPSKEEGPWPPSETDEDCPRLGAGGRTRF